MLQLKIEFQLVFGQFSTSSWSEKGHEPSWKSFSSSYGSSQLGLDLSSTYLRMYEISVD